MYPISIPSTYINEELIHIQGSKMQAYMYLHRQFGLSPLPSEAASTSTSLPPPIPMRYPARETNHAHIQVNIQDRNLTMRIITSQKHQEQQHLRNVGAVTASNGDEGRKRET
ncbi:hypothetical protein GGI35DRAFT_437452 [Trichoderma velutinum]